MSHLNKCFNCKQEINLCTDLLKLNDGNWYCQECITLSKEIFDLLKINGYWFNKLKYFTSFIKKEKYFGRSRGVV